MKKGLLLMIVMTAMTVINAQDSKVSRFLRIGAKAGANIGKIQGEGYDQAFRLGYYLGGFVQLNISRVIGIQPELLFSSGTVKTSGNFNDVYNTAGNNNTNITLNYLEIPILANVSLGSPRVKLQLGPQYSAYVGNKTVLQASGDAFKSGEFAAVGGLWFQLPVLNVHARYLLGLSDLDNITNSNKWKSQTIQVGVGLTF